MDGDHTIWRSFPSYLAYRHLSVHHIVEIIGGIKGGESRKTVELLSKEGFMRIKSLKILINVRR